MIDNVIFLLMINGRDGVTEVSSRNEFERIVPPRNEDMLAPKNSVSQGIFTIVQEVRQRSEIRVFDRSKLARYCTSSVSRYSILVVYVDVISRAISAWCDRSARWRGYRREEKFLHAIIPVRICFGLEVVQERAQHIFCERIHSERIHSERIHSERIHSERIHNGVKLG